MIWKDCSELKKRLKGKHALIGGSNYQWRNYDDEKIVQIMISKQASTIGTLLHDYAAVNINAGFKIYKGDKRSIYRYLVIENQIPAYAVDIDYLFPNLMNYVNDSIGYRMRAEELLYYSDECYGTTDAISFNKDVLRISDLKTGKLPVHFEQLENYAAFFCLFYKVKPSDIKKIELRIYQDGEIIFAEPDPSILHPIIEKAIRLNTAIERISDGGIGNDLFR